LEPTPEVLGASRGWPSPSPGFAVRVRFEAVQDLDSRLIGAWADLEQRALEPNAYLSPSFVLPAIRNLDPHMRTIVCVLEKEGRGTRDLVGLGVCVAVRRSLRFPLPHLRAYRSSHSHLGGLLLDRDAAAPAAEAFFRELQSRRPTWHGVEISAQFGYELGEKTLRQAAAAHGGTWQEYWRRQRAILVPAQAGNDYLLERLSRSRAKDLRRRWRRLAEQGPVRWRALTGPEITPACINRFLDLENLGWKARQGTSFRAQPHEERFFREMIDGFTARGRVVFTELWVGDQLVASTSNLISGKAAFAFKLGWNPDFHRVAPGFLNEVELIRNAPSVFEGLEFIDSGAGEGSFLDELWTARRLLIGGAYALTPIARKLLRTLDGPRRAKRWIEDRLVRFGRTRIGHGCR
jgi:CelD/BcsL family acetyltransferase involved in cellulose biosynthesis